MIRVRIGYALLLLFFVFVFGAAQAAETQLVVYYFHTDFRCASCRKIEQYTEEALEQNFSKELQSGRLVYKVINIDEKENKHFAADYQLYTKAVVLSLQDDGREVKYKNLTKVWEYLGDQNKFIRYIKDEVNSYLPVPEESP